MKVESFCFWTLPTWSWENETEAHEPHIVAPGQARCECCECHGSHPKAVEAEPASAKPETEYGTEDSEHLWIYWILLILFMHSASKKLARNTENIDQNSGKHLPHLQICLGKSHKEVLYSNWLCPREKKLKQLLWQVLRPQPLRKNRSLLKHQICRACLSCQRTLTRIKTYQNTFVKAKQNHNKTTGKPLFEDFF